MGRVEKGEMKTFVCLALAAGGAGVASGARLRHPTRDAQSAPASTASTTSSGLSTAALLEAAATSTARSRARTTESDVVWEVSLEILGTIFSLWSAVSSTGQGLDVSFTGVSWNETLAPGGTTSFGFCAEYY